MQALFWVGSILAGLMLAGALWEAWTEAAVRKRYPPPGRLVDVGGRRLHLHCAGPDPSEPGLGGPTVVIEAGRFNTSPTWALVQQQVATFARVCTYDRAGYAWSDPDRTRRTGERVAADLHALLHQAEIPGPFLLVGHSLGGMYVRCFAQAYPDEVAGVVLVDPYTEGEVRGQPPRLKALQARFGRNARLASGFGVVRLIAPRLRSITAPLSCFPLPLRRQIIALSCSNRLWRAVDDEWRELDGLAAQLGGPGSLGELPVRILSAGRCDMQAGGGFTQADVEQIWQLVKRSHKALTQLSTRAALVTLPDTGHAIPLERPEAIVQAVRDLLISGE